MPSLKLGFSEQPTPDGGNDNDAGASAASGGGGGAGSGHGPQRAWRKYVLTEMDVGSNRAGKAHPASNVVGGARASQQLRMSEMVSVHPTNKGQWLGPTLGPV